jgi:hypothetical protein
MDFIRPRCDQTIQTVGRLYDGSESHFILEIDTLGCSKSLCEFFVIIEEFSGILTNSRDETFEANQSQNLDPL